MRRICSALVAAVAGAAFGVSAVAVQSAELRPVITHQAALAMVAACIELATAEGWRMHIVVMDNGSNLVAYQKMTDAQSVSHDIAMAKARASSGINAATRQLAGFAFGENGPGAMAFVPGLNFFPGGFADSER